MTELQSSSVESLPSFFVGVDRSLPVPRSTSDDVRSWNWLTCIDKLELFDLVDAWQAANRLCDLSVEMSLETATEAALPSSVLRWGHLLKSGNVELSACLLAAGSNIASISSKFVEEILAHPDLVSVIASFLSSPERDAYKAATRLLCKMARTGSTTTLQVYNAVKIEHLIYILHNGDSASKRYVAVLIGRFAHLGQVITKALVARNVAGALRAQLKYEKRETAQEICQALRAMAIYCPRCREVVASLGLMGRPSPDIGRRRADSVMQPPRPNFHFFP